MLLLNEFVQITILQADKGLIEIFAEYLEYANVFLTDPAFELVEHININDHFKKLK